MNKSAPFVAATSAATFFTTSAFAGIRITYDARVEPYLIGFGAVMFLCMGALYLLKPQGVEMKDVAQVQLSPAAQPARYSMGLFALMLFGTLGYGMYLAA